MRALAWIGFSFFLFSCAHKEIKLCDNVTLKEGELKLSANEQVVVCGSSKGGEGWRDVPLPQAQYQLKVLLQEKGYLHPRFERNGGRLDVWSGPRAEFKDLKVEGAEGLLKASKKREVIGETITPDKLDEISQWAETELRSQGFGCPQVDVKAQVWDGIAKVSVSPGLRAKVGALKRTGLESLDEDTLARYLAFEPGDIYDVRETQVTVGRLLADGLIQSAYFTTQCHGDVVDLHLRADVGQPRLFRFGIGASTEELPFVDIWFKNTKLDDKASSLTATLHGSPRLQSLDLGTELYVLPWTKRSFFGPRFRFERKSEKFLEELSGKLGADLGRYWDMWKTRFRGRVGPTLNYVNTIQGEGPDDVSFLSWEGSLLAMSHVYEVGRATQWEGWDAGFEYDGQREGVGSYINVDRYEADFKQLWNLGSFSPPFLVLGTRFQGVAVDNRSKVSDPHAAKLPSDYRVFYGGDENLRGFSRKVLNNNDFGYLTAAYAGFELRLIRELPYALEPFILYDAAKLGDGRYNLDDPVFTSWGLGLRWASPFGTLRGSAARGEIYGEDKVADTYPQEWVYFFSFGQEF
jgi:translocation and assembly module TamA